MIGKNTYKQTLEYAYHLHQKQQQQHQHKDNQQLFIEDRESIVNILTIFTRKMNLPPKAFFLAITLADSYLMRHQITNQLERELVYYTSFWTVAKYNRYKIDDKVYLQLTGNKYQKKDMLTMERRLLNAIQFDMNIPTAFDFLYLLWEVEACTNTLPKDMMKQLIDSGTKFLYIMTLNDFYTTLLPSQIASVVLYLSRDFCHSAQLWNEYLGNCVQMKEIDVKNLSLSFIPQIKVLLDGNAFSHVQMQYQSVIEFRQMIEEHRKHHCCNNPSVIGSQTNTVIEGSPKPVLTMINWNDLKRKNCCYWETYDISCLNTFEPTCFIPFQYHFGNNVQNQYPYQYSETSQSAKFLEQ